METVTELPFLETEDTTLNKPPRTYSSLKAVKEAQLKTEDGQDEDTDTETVTDNDSVKKPRIIKKATISPKK